MAAHVRDILKQKGTNVFTVDSDATVFHAIELMVQHNVGSLLVLDPNPDPGESPVEGIFTERDYLRRIALKGRTSRTTKVEEVMTSEVISVSPFNTVKECMQLMTEAKIRHLPVVEDGELQGLISIGDCVRQVSRDAQTEVAHLQSYIQSVVMGRYPA
ncbi:histidine kinase [Longibacter salinarum]|uniref:Histidine kinase n=1 Tax=Longibacter salinarum TaxID=1850348 RepID=A0A2A8D084_9BACT|nr:CBS domain-containing protein [Longibacter salinarum]PEN14326.1 histidine kinase [Longibacter salinarum]